MLLRSLIVLAATAVALPLARGADLQTDPSAGQPVPNRAPLAPTPFIRLPIGSVKAQGWLLRQLELQKAGLTGSAEQLYDALQPDSAWLGGRGEAWEKGPYYVKGLIALAHTLDDKELQQRAQKWVDWALNSQREDGFFGPASNDDWWPRMVVLFYLRDHYEATGDARVIPFFTKYFRNQLANLPKRPLKDWGRARAGDNIDVVLWTYNKTGDTFLLDLAKLLHDQAYPWTNIFTANHFYDFGEDFQPHHIVNVNQALKFSPIAWQFTKDDADLKGYAAGIANLNRQYGRIDGQISGTEMLSGLSSTAGVELCADVERIISTGISATILGDAELGDEMEKVAYNSLPAHTSPRMQQITYYQLLNQVTATQGGHGFTQDYGNGNVPGPHSGFPCCCYNWHAGWPKFVQQMWAATADGGLAAIAYGPNKVTTTVAGGVPVSITQTTDYPFAEAITLNVDPQHPIVFPLRLHVPAWCTDGSYRINGEPVNLLTPGTFYEIKREWKPGDVVSIHFPMTVRASTWVNQSIGFERGPLAFALKIDESWKKDHEYMQNFDEYEVLPKSPWNYAVQLDRTSPAAIAAAVQVKTNPVPAVPWSTEAPPVVLTLPARKLPEWGLKKATGGRAVIGRANNGWTSLGEKPVAVAADVPHHLRVEAKGESINVFVDDMTKPVFTRNDAPTTGDFSAGSIGLRTYDASAAFDDIKLDGKTVADFASPAQAANWRIFGGQWTIRNGAYTTAPAKDGKTVLKGHENLRDFTLDATITLKAGGDAGVIFRVANPSAKADGYMGYYVGLSAHAQSQDADEPPVSPVTSTEPVEQVELIPFGSAKLRVSYFPVLGK